MSDYIVKDTELTSVANAIRTKGGTNSQLVFPGGFVSAIGNISGGGGSSDFSTAELTVIQGTPSPDAGVIEDVPVIKNDTLQVFALEGSSPVPVTETVVLYKGSLILDANPDTFISASGNASYDSDNEKLTITGDCTLTLSYMAF